MTYQKLDPELQLAFERGCKSVRDKTHGNPYAVASPQYKSFEQGIKSELDENHENPNMESSRSNSAIIS